MCRNIRRLQIFAIFAVTFDPLIHVQREYFYTNNFLIVIFLRIYRTMYISVFTAAISLVSVALSKSDFTFV
jgi:hypothetical protein